MTKRIQITKKTRFDVFARDGYACKYCGCDSTEHRLEVDHIIPVSKGGTNDIENLVTSCQPCNLGKGARTPNQAVITEEHKLMLAQQRQEQLHALKMARQSIKARQKLQDLLAEHWTNVCYENNIDNRGVVYMPSFRVVFSFIQDHGFDQVCRWIDIAGVKCYNQKDMGKYISGIRRSIINKQQEVDNG